MIGVYLRYNCRSLMFYFEISGEMDIVSGFPFGSWNDFRVHYFSIDNQKNVPFGKNQLVEYFT